MNCKYERKSFCFFLESEKKIEKKKLEKVIQIKKQHLKRIIALIVFGNGDPISRGKRVTF